MLQHPDNSPGGTDRESVSRLGAARHVLVGCVVFAAMLSPEPLLAQSAAARATAEQEKGLADQASDYVKDYLSDNRRVGALAGSILGGALTAHPAGPVLGSVVGFFIGKKTMFEETPDQAPVQSANRAIIPDAAQAASAPTLSFSNPAGLSFAAPAPIQALPSPAQTTELITPSTPAVMTPPSLAPRLPAGFSRDQIASLCAGGGSSEPRLRSLCFYFQGQ